MIITLLFAQIIPLDDPAYIAIARLEAKGALQGLPDTRPYTEKQVFEAFNSEAALSRADSFDLASLGIIKSRFKRWAPALRLQGNGGESGASAFFKLGGAVGASYKIPDSLRAGPEVRYEGGIGPFSFFATHRITYAPKWDSCFDAKSWRGDERPVFAEIPDARLDVDFDWLHIQAGRSEIHMGPVPDGGLILSTEPWGIDHAAYTLHWKGVNFTTLFSWLQADKRLIMHRFEYASRTWKLGLSEALVANDSNDVFVYIAAPFAFYYFMQWNKLQDENILWSADAEVFLRPFKIYAEFIVDDFAYEPATGPNKIGGTIGAQWVSIFKSEVDLRADYTAITKWTYAQRHDNQNYTFRGRILGDDLGPDADRARVYISWRVAPPITLGFDGRYERHGEGDEWRDFQDDGAADSAAYHPPFPSGVVENRFSGRLDLKLTLIGRSYLDVWGKLVQTTNLDNVQGNNTTRARVGADLFWEF